MKKLHLLICYAALLPRVFYGADAHVSESTLLEHAKVVALSDHIELRSLPPGSPTPTYGVYFVDVSSSWASNAICLRFQTNLPPIIVGTNRIQYDERMVSRDRISGLRGIVFQVVHSSVQPPMATVRTCASTGNTGAEFMLYSMELTKGGWRIVKRKPDGFASNRRGTVATLAAW